MLSLATVLAVGLTTSQSDPSPCSMFEARLQVATGAVKKGQVPQFTLLLRNKSAEPLRFVDTRLGRRKDLGDTYYQLVVKNQKGKEPDVSRAISDPGPVSASDYGSLEPGASIEIRITTPMLLEELRMGSYKAHVVVWPDPYRKESRCRSTATDFRVQ
jgi:hypothetical protein